MATSLRLGYEMVGFERAAEAFPKAASSALNKTAAQARTYATRTIRDRYNVKISMLRAKSKGGIGGIALIRSTPRSLAAKLRPSGATVSLIALGAKWNPRSPGVTVAVERGKPQIIRGAFIRTGRKSGKEYVLRRMQKARTPIKIVPGVKVRDMFFAVDTIAKLKAFVRLKLKPIFNHELEFFKR